MFTKTLETDRLRIESLNVGHSEVVNQSSRESYAILAPWLFWANPDPAKWETIEDTRKVFATFQADVESEKSFHGVLFEKSSGKHVGMLAFQNPSYTGEHFKELYNPNGSKIKSLDIGYWLNINFTGKGLMSEAINAVWSIAVAEKWCEALTISAHVDNAKSIHVAKRLGMEHLKSVETWQPARPDWKQPYQKAVYVKFLQDY